MGVETRENLERFQDLESPRGSATQCDHVTKFVAIPNPAMKKAEEQVLSGGLKTLVDEEDRDAVSNRVGIAAILPNERSIYLVTDLAPSSILQRAGANLFIHLLDDHIASKRNGLLRLWTDQYL